MFLGKSDLVGKIVDTVTKVGLGALGGWGIAKTQSANKLKNQNDSAENQ